MTPPIPPIPNACKRCGVGSWSHANTLTGHPYQAPTRDEAEDRKQAWINLHKPEEN